MVKNEAFTWESSRINMGWLMAMNWSKFASNLNNQWGPVTGKSQKLMGINLEILKMIKATRLRSAIYSCSMVEGDLWGAIWEIWGVWGCDGGGGGAWRVWWWWWLLWWRWWLLLFDVDAFDDELVAAPHMRLRKRLSSIFCLFWAFSSSERMYSLRIPISKHFFNLHLLQNRRFDRSILHFSS